ncbi:hypothetical protein [Actinophytocola sediminis]
MVEDPTPRRRTARAPAVTIVLTVLFAALFSGAAHGALAPAITVSKNTGLNPSGDTITVTGSGFDVHKGIYVAVCVDNGPGQVPTPCLGGVDTGGAGGGSAWISSNPPSYGAGLATPYGQGGSFSVTLSVVAVDPVTGTDCRAVACAAVTRADHTRTADRGQDTRVALSFAAPAPKPKPAPAPKPTTAAPPPPPVTTTTPAPTTTTTTTTTTSAPPSSSTTASADIAETAARPAEPDRTGWWFGGAGAVLAAVLVLVFLRVRRARATPTDPS